MRDLYSDVTARIVSQMEAGNVPWIKTWKLTGNRTSRFPVNAATNRPYSGVNVLLLWMGAEQGLPRYLTFKQAQSFGGHVRKGEHGSKVYFFKQLTVKDKKSGEDKNVPLLREYTVFHVSQCDGLPDHVVNGPDVAAPLNLDERESLADEFIKSTNADFREGAGQPCYVPSLDCIRMPPFATFKTCPAFYSVAFHELIHWTGAKRRLDRDLTGRFGTRSYAAEELVAELGAAFINAEFGFDMVTNNAAYLQTWIALLKDDSRAIFTAASKANKACEYLRGLSLASGEGSEQADDFAIAA
jgi:antirestriction protein ArdC